MAETAREREAWQDRGACVAEDPDVFFPDDGNYDKARAICAECEVKLICLDYAMRNKAIKDGMWGGTSPEQRRKARRRQRLREMRATDGDA